MLQDCVATGRGPDMNGFVRPEIEAIVSQLSLAIDNEERERAYELLKRLESQRDQGGLTCDEAYLCLGLILIGLPGCRSMRQELNAARISWRRFIYKGRNKANREAYFFNPIANDISERSWRSLEA